jgi:hypothetical protein
MDRAAARPGRSVEEDRAANESAFGDGDSIPRSSARWRGEEVARWDGPGAAVPAES